jgi:signal transduction histidine kinase
VRFRSLLAILLLGFAATITRAVEAGQPVPAAERGLPAMRLITPREYGGHFQTWNIAETRDGLLLFSNLNAVVEHDGQSWRSIPVKGGSYLRAMIADAAGTVWVAGENEIGRFVPGPDGKLAYESMRAQVPAEVGNFGSVWRAHRLADGVYFCSNIALLRWDGKKFDFWRVDSKRTALSFDFGGAPLVVADFGWKIARPGGEWAEITGAPSPAVNARFLLPRGDGTWSLGTGVGGLRIFHADGRVEPLPTSFDDWLAKSRPYDALLLRDGRRVVPSVQGGAVIASANWEPELWLGEQTGLPTSTVICAFQDRRGVLWLGTDRGIVRVEINSPVTIFNRVHGVPLSGLERIARVRDRVLVSGTSSVLELHPPARPLEQAKFEPIEANGDRVLALVQLPDGMLSGGVTGVRWISNGKSEKIDGPPGVREVIELPGSPGRFLGTHLSGLCSWRREQGRWVYEGEWKDVRGEIRGLVPAGGDAVWTATSNEGVLRITPDPAAPRAQRIERFAEESGLVFNRNRVWLHRTPAGPLFGTEADLFRFDEATQRFRPARDLGPALADVETRVRLLTNDDRGGLWVALESHQNQARKIVYLRDGRIELLPLPAFSLVGSLTFLEWERHGAKEILWIGGSSEVWQVDLVRWRDAATAPLGMTLLREVSAGGRSYRSIAGEVPRFPAKENTLRFRVATPGLASEPFPRHETRLVGFRDGETVVSTAPVRTFTNLPAGDYVFEARGLSDDERASEPVRFAFKVLAPWWQTTWAGAAYLIFGTALLVLYVRWRIRRLTRERARLEQVIVERTAELARKNVELERLHRLDQDEKFAARLAEEKAQLELLRYQLNPHFLYNSLNSIRALVFTNAEAAGEMVTRLSEFCRWTLTRGAEGVTTVSEEVEMLQSYLDIERTRWQDGLQARIEVETAVGHVRVPQFLFLPLIENAIKYGGRTSPGVLEVAVRFSDEGDAVRCEVANTGSWMESPPAFPDSTRIGLENLRQRVARHYGADCALQIDTSRPGWVAVVLRLPKQMRSAGSRSPVEGSLP